MADVYTNPEKHVVLSNNVKLPILGLGTSHDGGYSHEAVVWALQECGYRHIDTAKRYGCETYIAQAVKASGVPREDIFLTTKCWPADYGADTTKKAFTGSCQRLDTEYLDMYLLHWPEVPTGTGDKRQVLRDTWRALEVLLDEERVRVIGVSNFLEQHLDDIIEDCSVTPHLNQCEFHPFNNPKHLRQYCKDHGIQFEGYCPLGNGQILNEPELQEIAEIHGKSPAQILIRWNIQQGVVCIPKSTKKHRVKENSQVFDFVLRKEDMTSLDNMKQTVTCVNRATIQDKIDNPLPDGYKLNLSKVTVEP